MANVTLLVIGADFDLYVSSDFKPNYFLFDKNMKTWAPL